MTEQAMQALRNQIEAAERWAYKRGLLDAAERLELIAALVSQGQTAKSVIEFAGREAKALRAKAIDPEYLQRGVSR